MSANIEKLSDAELVAAIMEKLFGEFVGKLHGEIVHAKDGESPRLIPLLDGNLMLRVIQEMHARDFDLETHRSKFIHEDGSGFTDDGLAVAFLVFAGKTNAKWAYAKKISLLPRTVCIVALLALEQADA